MIGKLVAGSHADTARTSGGIDEIYPGDFCFFAPVFRIPRHEKRFTMCTQRRTRALVEPLLRCTAAVRLGTAPLHPRAKHAHAIGQRLFVDPGASAARHTRSTPGGPFGPLP